MGLMSAIESAQVRILQKLRFFRRLQGIRQTSERSLLQRKSFADLGPIDPNKMTLVYKVSKGSLLANRSRTSAPILIVLLGGMCYKMYNENTQILRSLESDHEKRDILSGYAKFFMNVQRVVALFLAPYMLILAMRPSRSVRAIYLARLSHQPCMIVECNRLLGSVPNYYIFDGKEERRIIEALKHEQAVRASKGAGMGARGQQSAREDYKKFEAEVNDAIRASQIGGGDQRTNQKNTRIDVSPVKIEDGCIRFSKNLYLLGEAPRWSTKLDLNALDGKFAINRDRLTKGSRHFPLLRQLQLEIPEENLQNKTSTELTRSLDSGLKSLEGRFITHFLNQTLQLFWILVALQLCFGLPFLSESELLENFWKEKRAQFSEPPDLTVVEEEEVATTFRKRQVIKDDLE